MKTVKAVIYARTSQDAIADSGKENKISIEIQIEECQKIAKKSGYEVVGIFHDRNLSSVTYPVGFEKVAESDEVFKDYMARTSKRTKEYFRPALGEVMKMLDNIDVVIVRDETRLMRPLIYSNLLGSIYGKFLTKKVRLHIADGNRIIDPSRFEHAFMSTVISMTEVNSMLTKIDASKLSLHKKRNEGFLFGSMTRFGFQSTKKQTVEIVEKEAAIIRRVYSMMLKEHIPINQIVRTFNDEKIASHKNGKWTHQLVLKILKRLEYTGHQYNTEGDIISCIPLQGKEIITLNDWHKVQAILNTNKRFNKKSENEVRPLTGLCFCAYCKERLYVAKSQQFGNGIYNSYYICKRGGIDQKKSELTQGCRMVNIREKRPTPYTNNNDAETETLSRNGIREIIAPLLFQYVLDEKRKNMLTNGDYEAKKHKAHTALAKVDTHLKSLSDMLFEEQISKDEFLSMTEKSRKSKTNLTKELKELETEANMPSLDILDNHDIIETAFKIFLNQIDPMTFRDIARRVIERIEIAAYSVRVYFKAGGHFDLERVPVTSSRAMPNVWPVCNFSKNYMKEKYDVQYLYKSFFNKQTSVKEKEPKLIFENEIVRIFTKGSNPKPNEYLKKRKQTKRLAEGKQLPDYVLHPF